MFLARNRNRQFLMMAVIAWASSPFIVSSEGQEAPLTLPVQGTVLNSVTREPIARALVDGHEDAVLTDNDGHFALNLPGGDMQIEVRRPGYTSKGRQSQHLVRVGKEMPDLTFYLTPQASIKGRILLSGGVDMDEMRVMAYSRIVSNSQPSWMLHGSYKAGSEGDFRIWNLDAPGSYMLCTIPRQDENPSAALEREGFGYPSVCFPGGADLSAGSLLTLSPGQQAQVDISVMWQPFYPVSIAVSNRAQGAVPSIQIRDQSGRATGLPVKLDAEQGLARVDLPNGLYYAEARGRGEPPSYGRADFQVANGPVSGLSLVVLPLRPIPVHIGTASLDGGSSNSPRIPQSNAMGAGISLTLVPLSSPLAGPAVAGRIRPVSGSPDRSLFEMDGVVPGTYRVQTAASQGYVSSILSGAADLAHEPLVIGPGNSAAPIEVSLRNDGGSISGVVNLPSSMAAGSSGSGTGELNLIHVYSIPLFPSSSQIPSQTIRSGNRFNIGNLAPGTYSVLAFDKEPQIDSTDPEQLARVAAKGLAVIVPAGGAAIAQLELTEPDQEGATP